MRLRKIKLAGFKSFVDPTSIEFPSDLIAVVGPNGCGKSNIIDAVRWVMGEISAKHLRGESMADVVFSGSSARKPVGQAAVELIFDNSEGRLGGRYAEYAEIAVKRQVSRDASQSHYFLNGSRCRRRDVQDVFLGTGLGPRSYAIIEQGMISRLIEAKPEELREFLEEAAGISKYKERRRETENRISHARENLDRLNDLRDELEQRLQHLKRQAGMAEKYKVLKQAERLLKAELLSLRWRGLSEQAERDQLEVRQQQNALEAAVAEQRRLENTLEQQRTAHTSATDEFNAIYRRVLEAGAEIARVEESIQHLRARRIELKESLEREETNREEASGHLRSERAQLDELTQALSQEEPELERLREAEAGSRSSFGRSESVMQELQAVWESLNQQAAESSELAHAERARLTHLEAEVEELRRRIAKLETEFAELRPDELNAQLTDEQGALDEEERGLRSFESRLQAKQASIEHLRERLGQASEHLHRARERYQECKGRLASLQALQEEALGKRPGAVTSWLEARSLTGEPRLAEQVEVESGWERAVETVLGFHLEAICVENVDLVGRELPMLEEGGLGLFDVASQLPTVTRAKARAGPMLEKVTAPGGLGSLLEGVFVVERVEEALELRPELAARESVVTRDGIWVGPNWLRYARTAIDGAGVLSREQEIKEIFIDVGAAGREVAIRNDECEAALATIRERESEAVALRETFAEQHHRFAARQAGVSARRAELEQARARAAAIGREITELSEQEQRVHSDLKGARGRLVQHEAELDRLAGERDACSERRREHRQQLDTTRERWQAVRDDVYQVGVRAETMRAKVLALESGIARNQEQVARLQARCRELREAFSGTEAPLRSATESLEQKLSARREVDASLDTARAEVESAESSLRETEQKRSSVERKVETERACLEELKMQTRDTVVRRTTLEEQLAESGHEVERVLEALPPEAQESEWEQRLEKAERRIARLGPINLAAIDEYNQESERKAYLDAQNDDLVEALETLEQAIRKIDRETRTRFKETYEKVNSGLAETFPRLFAGGTAFLQMTGEDLLSTGISVMARPPGKRNTSIHLLSGGEKALTAIALVFSIFELNPAPFCLLDEVDAPLDDANVGRFCELVKGMTDRVQCVLVTHNKATMEMTNQLIGVTMNEPGISRLVAVDVDEAVELAAV